MKLLPVSTVARRLSCSTSTVYGLIASGQLLCIRRGVKKGYSVPEDSVERFLRERIVHIK